MDLKEQTNHTRTVYNRRAGGMARVERMDLRVTRRLRAREWAPIAGAKNILEVGVGTGMNFAFYPPGAHVTAVDLGERMIELAQAKAERTGLKNIELRVMDVQKLDFPDDAFDAVAATFVFCSVPDPLRGLEEISRVLRPGGKAVFLEHVRSANRLVGWMMDRLDPLTHRYGGMHINRRTVENIDKSALDIETVEDVAMGGIVKLIIAGKKNAG